MLILAGVSLNAIVGDNGIITNAQNASVQSGMAALEEFLQEKYVEIYDKTNENETKIETMERYFPEFFYIPSLPENGSIGNLRFIVDTEGHAYYLIKKSGLPQEISEQLKGGEAGNGSYRDYLSLKDVYGVTSDLKVYYSSGNKEELISLNGVKLDEDKTRIVFSNLESGIGKLISVYDSNNDGKLTNTEINGLKDIEICDEEMLNLDDFFNFINLEKVVIKNSKIESLKGIENCPNIKYISFESSNIGDYSGIGKLGKSLKYLYFINTTNDEVNKLGDGLKNYDLPSLQYLGFFKNLDAGELFYWNNFTIRNYQNTTTELSDISSLSKLTNITKKAVRYLYLQNNKIESLECLSEFENLYYIRAQNNKIKNLKGLENKNKLTYICLRKNNLTDVEDGTQNVYSISNLETDSSIYWLDLAENDLIVKISFLENCKALRYLFLENNLSMNKQDIASVKDFLNSMKLLKIDSSYSWSLIDDENTTRIDLRGQTVKRSDFELLKNCKNLNYLDIGSVKFVKDDGSTLLTSSELNLMLNSILPNFTKVVELCLENLKFDDFSFYSKMTALKALDLYGTNVTTSGTNCLTLLNTYKHVGTLRINNSEIDLSKIQPALDYMSNHGFNIGPNGRSEHIFNSYSSGLQVENSIIMKTLEKCTELTRISFSQQGYIFNDSNLILDLSNLNQLTSFDYIYINVKSIKLPKCIKNLNIVAESGYYEFATQNDSTLGNTCDLESCYIREYTKTNDLFTKLVSNCKKLTRLEMYENFMNRFDFNNLKNHNSLNYILITIPTWTKTPSRYSDDLDTLNSLKVMPNLNQIVLSYISLTDLSCVKELSNLKIFKCKQCDISDISGLSGLTGLNELDLTECKIVNIEPVKNCINLTHLELWNNSISTGFKGLLSLKNLNFLSLSNNSIDDTDFMDDKRYFVQDIFVQMNKTKSGGEYNLEELYIKGNKFTDFSKLLDKSVVWKGKNGF